tara:strand:+ start:25728 stop:26777 length:1050 start_codon:yes stop_codon:yes gene_type:complete
MLTKEQEKKAVELAGENKELMEITRDIFEDQSLDGRCRQGRDVREFLQKQGLKYKTTKKERASNYISKLKEQDLQFIQEHFDEMTAVQMAKVLFGEDITAAHNGARLIRDEVEKLMNTKMIVDKRTFDTHPYEPPRTIKKMCEKINKVSSSSLNHERLSAMEKMGVNKILKSMATPRFTNSIRKYVDLEHREVFESQYIDHTWDKPDLTTEEIALYVNLCSDYVSLIVTSKHLEKLSRIFENMADDDVTTVSMATNIKEKNDEYDKIAKRIQSLIEKLNGKRSDRIKNQQNRNVSILPMIQEFQAEEGRKRMIAIAEMQRDAASSEADRIESLPDLKARLLGISKSDVL